MADAATLAVRVQVEGANQAEKQLGGVAGAVQRNSQNIRRAGMAMTAFGAATTGVGVLALKMSSDFDKGMREVNTLLNLSETQFAGLQSDVRDLAVEIGVTATDIVPSLYQAISAGVPKENVMEFITMAAKAAIGGVTDTETAVDGLTSVINAYGKSASEAGNVADIMFTVVRLGKLNFEELSASLFNVVPIAAATGIEFDTVAAAMAALTAQGVPASVASTQLRAAIQSLSAPTVRQAKMMKELNLDFGDGRLAQVGLSAAFKESIAATGGNMEQLRKLIGSVEGLQAVLALGGEQAHKFDAALLGMAESAGASEASFEEMDKSTSRQMDKMKSSIGELALTIGDVLLPAITPLIDKAAVMAKAIGEWTKEHPGLTKVIIAVTAAVGGLALVLGPILLVLPGIIALLPILGAAFGVLLGPVGLVIAAVAALVAIWTTDFMGLREPIERIARAIINMALNPIRQAIDIVKLAVKLFKGDWRGAWDQIKLIVQRAVNMMLGVINTLLQGMATAIKGLKALLDAIPGGNPFGNMLQGAIDKLEEGIPLWETTNERVREFVANSVGMDRFAEGLGEQLLVMQELGPALEEGVTQTDRFAEGLGEQLRVSDALRASLDSRTALRYQEVHGWEQTTEAIDDATLALLRHHKAAVEMAGIDLGTDPRGFGFNISGVGTGIEGRLLGAVAAAAGIPQLSASNYERLIGTGLKRSEFLADIQAGREPFQFAQQDLTPAMGFAHGGIVTRPTLAMLGERGPEAVIPLSGRGGGGINVNINGPVYGLHDLEEQIVEAITRRARAGGFEGMLAGA